MFNSSAGPTKITSMYFLINSRERLSILLHHLPYWMLSASGYLFFFFIYQFSSSCILLPMNDCNGSLIIFLSCCLFKHLGI